MSFSKARIQRFNELKSQVPPPGAYDPKHINSKVKSSSKTSVSSNVSARQVCTDASVASSNKSSASTSSRDHACNASTIHPPTSAVKPFRTPQVPKKRAVVRPNARALSCPRAKTKLYNNEPQHEQNKDVAQYDSQQELADLRVELLNKTETIRDYEKLLQDLKAELAKSHLEAKNREEEEQQQQHENCTQSQQQQQQQPVDNACINDDHAVAHTTTDAASNRRRARKMTRQLRQDMGVSVRDDEEEDDEEDRSSVILDEGENQLDDCLFAEIKKFGEDLRADYERDIELSKDCFNQEREHLEQLLDKQQATIIQLQDQLAEADKRNECTQERLDDLAKLYKETTHRLQDCKDQVGRLEVQLSESRQTHELELKNNHEQITYLRELIDTAKREYLQEVANLEASFEEEKKRMKECADKMIGNAETVTRETLQACRSESEEKVRRIIGETQERIKTQENEYKDNLSRRDSEINRLTLALEELKCSAETQASFGQSLQSELDRAEAELAEKKTELRNLKDQLRNESAEMVTRRRRFDLVMAENQATVGALSQRLAQSQLDNEALQRQLDQLSLGSALLRQQLDTIANSLDRKLDSIERLETVSLNQINLAKSHLTSDLDQFKNAAIQQIDSKSKQNAELENNLRQMSERLTEATDMLMSLEQLNDEQSIDMAHLQLQMSKLEQQLDARNRQMQESDSTFQEHQRQHENLLAEMGEQLSKIEQEARMWQRKYKEIEAERDRLLLIAKNDSQTLNSSFDKRQQAVERQKNNINVQQQIDSKSELADQIDGGQCHEKLLLKLEARRQIGTGKENHVVLSPRKHLFPPPPPPSSASTTPVSSPSAKLHLTPLRARND